MVPIFVVSKGDTSPLLERLLQEGLPAALKNTILQVHPRSGEESTVIIIDRPRQGYDVREFLLNAGTARADVRIYVPDAYYRSEHWSNIFRNTAGIRRFSARDLLIHELKELQSKNSKA